MQELRIEVQEVMENELKRANDVFPLFNSAHEGISIIEEEYFESDKELAILEEKVKDIKIAVFTDKPVRELHSIARQGVISAIEAACELIQVAAMFDKFRTSIDQKKADEAEKSEFMSISQEELDRKVDEFFGVDGNVEHIVHKVLAVSPDQMHELFDVLKKMEGKNGNE